MDSVKTFTSESAEGLPGNVSQVRAVATEIVDACKRGTTTVVLVGHVTKDGAPAAAWPWSIRSLLEGDRRQMFRLLRVLKNRLAESEPFRADGLQMIPAGLKSLRTRNGLARDEPQRDGVVMAVDRAKAAGRGSAGAGHAQLLSIPGARADLINRLSYLNIVLENACA